MARRKKVIEEELVIMQEAAEDSRAAVDNDATVSAKADAMLIAVNVVVVAGDRYVLEWRDAAGSLRRSWSSAIVTMDTEEALSALEPYGDDLSTVVRGVHWSQAEVLEELHRMGVWRLEELNANVLNDLYQGFARLAVRDALKRKMNKS